MSTYNTISSHTDCFKIHVQKRNSEESLFNIFEVSCVSPKNYKCVKLYFAVTTAGNYTMKSVQFFLIWQVIFGESTKCETCANCRDLIFCTIYISYV